MSLAQRFARRSPPRAGALHELPAGRIARQILLLQGIFYGVAALLMLFSAAVAGQPFNFGMVLGWQGVRGDTTIGYMLGVVWLLDSIIW